MRLSPYQNANYGEHSGGLKRPPISDIHIVAFRSVHCAQSVESAARVDASRHTGILHPHEGPIVRIVKDALFERGRAVSDSRRDLDVGSSFNNGSVQKLSSPADEIVALKGWVSMGRHHRTGVDASERHNGGICPTEL